MPLRNEKFQKFPLIDAQNAVIDDGIKVGETVVTAGQYRLANGTPVNATAGDEKTASADKPTTAE